MIEHFEAMKVSVIGPEYVSSTYALRGKHMWGLSADTLATTCICPHHGHTARSLLPATCSATDTGVSCVANSQTLHMWEPRLAVPCFRPVLFPLDIEKDTKK